MITNNQLLEIANKSGTPLFIYDSKLLADAATELLGLELPYGCTVRYAVKANPHPGVVKLFNDLGLHFDASSTYEAQNLLRLGVQPRKVSLSGQTLEGPLKEVISNGVLPVATSLHQIELLAKQDVKHLAVRVNPGVGSGHSQKTNVGGPSSSFGIWHEYVPQVIESSKKLGVKIDQLHTHIGSGAESHIWQKTIDLSLKIAEKLTDVKTLDIGGGYKVGRMTGEQSADMSQIARIFSQSLKRFAAKTGRELHLEIEPGSFLVANAGVLLARVEDVVDTGNLGYTFLRLNTGMNDILRPSLYGAQHPIKILNDSSEKQEYVLVGHNCESGDLLTPAIGDPEAILPRLLNKAQIGDIAVIGGTGAYCASMRAIGYNSFPGAKEVLV